MSERTQPISVTEALERTAEVRSDGSSAGESGPKTAQSAVTLPANGAARDEADEALVGRILAGRYQLESVLGRGGMGVVFSGRHIAINRPIAVKVLRRNLASSGDAVTRFHREARAAASIGSPHIVEVFDFGFTDEGDAFIAMERLEGTDLRKLVREAGALAPGRALAIARQIARGLSAAHARGIVHRDLKSENVFVCSREGGEHIKLLDFGISKVTELDDTRGPLTSEGVVMGTPHYMAPELLHGAMAADARADIYALGCVLYEMLTGGVPFNGRTPMEVAYKHVHEAVEPPSKRRPGLSPALDALVLRALEKQPDKRFDNTDAFVRALDELERAPSSTLPPPVVSEAPSAPSRRPLALFSLAALASVAAVGLALRTPSTPSTVGRADGSDAAALFASNADATSDEGTTSESVGPRSGGDPETTDASPRGDAELASSFDVWIAESNGALQDTGVRRVERGPNGFVRPPVVEADVVSAVPVPANTPDVALAPLVPDAAPRGPDDGLKQTPYGAAARRGR
ncbi:MAG: protein kinase [Myxococcales bacterium]|nr:protein kinase [Myxococcales bacterium]